MSLSIQILDLYDDVTGSLLKWAAQASPSFMKTAQIARRDEVAKLPTDAFALHALTKEGSRLKKYPIHSAADTWLSCAYFEKNAHKLPAQAARIAATHLKVACDKFHIDANSTVIKMASQEAPASNLYIEEMDGLRKMASHAVIEERSSEGHYALPGRYPLFHEGHVKKATSYFGEHFKSFDPADRFTFAKNVLSRASELELSTDSSEFEPLKKIAGESFGDRVETQLSLRRKLFDGHVDSLVDLEKIAEAKTKLEPEQFAGLLHAWDKENGVDRTYGSKIVDPYQATFETMNKEAGYVWEDEKSGMTLTGTELEKAASAKYDKIKGYFGETLANSLKKHGSQIFESLPIDAKAVIAKIAKGTL